MSALDDFAIACTWAFGVVGFAGSAVTVAAIRRRPRVAARWLWVDHEPHQPWEGLAVDVRPRQRPVRIEALELELRYGPHQGWRRQRSKVSFTLGSHPTTPVVLQDGDVLSSRMHTDDAVEEAHRLIGDERLNSESYVVVTWGGGHIIRVPSQAGPIRRAAHLLTAR
jgi:hypothetical protein